MKDKVIAVIDMRAFYSYVECVDRGLNPWCTPLVVADKDRGKNTIVLSVTPYLKSLGVPSRLRIRDLPKRNDYIYAVPRMERYLEKSSQVMSIILRFVDEEDLHIYSIDEAFVNLGPYLNYYGKSANELVQEIKLAINAETGLECTAGIGDSMFLAKVALDRYAKKEKNGIAELYKKDIKEKLWPLHPLNTIWGIGENLQRRLNALGMYKMGDIAKANRDFMKLHFGVIGDDLVDHANGIDNSNIREKYVPKEKSLTAGQVLFKDYSPEEAKLIIKELCDDLMTRLRLGGKMTGCVSLYIGYSKQGGFSAQMSLLKDTDDTDIVYETLLEIYKKHVENMPIRRISIALSKLRFFNNFEQLDLFVDSETSNRKRNLQFTIDHINQKYGRNSILRTSALLESSTIIERHSFIGGHKR